MTLLKHAIAALALSGTLLPEPFFAAETRQSAQFDTEVRDVAMSPTGRFQARVMSPNGVPLADQPITLLHGGRIVAQSVSDSSGRILVSHLKGGPYELRTGHQIAQVRIWTSDAAPPLATQELLLVNNEDIVRAQQPLGNLFCQEPVMIAVLVAAAIAIPIAIHDSGSDSGS